MLSQAHDSEQIRNELTLLLNKQVDILEKETFGAVTNADLNEYEDRLVRICELYSELTARGAAECRAARVPPAM